jgi:fatty acid desaturase
MYGVSKQKEVKGKMKVKEIIRDCCIVLFLLGLFAALITLRWYIQSPVFYLSLVMMVVGAAGVWVTTIAK